jgi:hypothetical protein
MRRTVRTIEREPPCSATPAPFRAFDCAGTKSMAAITAAATAALTRHNISELHATPPHLMRY